MKFGIGQAVLRKEDRRFVTGKGRYLADITLPGETRAVFLRSPHAHAIIRSIDLSAAKAAPGVLTILTGADVEAEKLPPLPVTAGIKVKRGTPELYNPPLYALAVGRVRHVGDAVAIVVAETHAQATDAAELIDVDYEILPAIADLAKAVEPGAPQIWPNAPNNVSFTWESGDEAATDAAFAKAARIVSIELINNRVVVNSMETRGAIGVYSEAEGYLLYTSSQGSHMLKDVFLGTVFKGTDPARFRVITPDVGGGFGMKVFPYPEQAAVLWAAKKVGRPVKWIGDRLEAFLADCHGRDNVTRAEMALDPESRFIGLRVKTLGNMGGYLAFFAPFIVTESPRGMHSGCYRIPAVHAEVKGVFTNTAPVNAYRGAGRPEAAYMIERLVDKIGRDTGLGPIEIRRRNFVPASAMPYSNSTGKTFDSGDFEGNMDDALSDADWAGFAARREDSRARGKLRGIGLGYYIEVCGGAGAPVPALLRFEPDDTVSVVMGTQSNGQGHETAYSQIVSERLGIPFEKVIIRQGDTSWAKTGTITGGSRSVPVGGVSAQRASDEAIEKGKSVAAELLEASAGDIEFTNGRYVIAGTDRAIDIFAVAKAVREGRGVAPGAPRDLTGAAEFTPPVGTFPNGCHICELEVDPETGITTVLRYTVVDDFGTVVNPLLLEGQVHGGLAQGIGQALQEHGIYGADGQMLSASFMDYAMPRVDMMPPIAFRWNAIPCTTNPLGIKGAGEAGAIGAPQAVINAIINALTPLGIGEVDMPATPLRIWNLIHEAAR
jgi:carbon-monoxide dehydrogenase large subunit